MILYFDTETSGLRPGNICQLSYVMQDKEEVKAKNFFFTVDYVEAGALSVHGFSVDFLRSVSNGKRFEYFIKEIKEDFERADLVVSHNTSFDFMFLSQEFIRCDEALYLKDHLCSMKKSTPLLGLRRSNSAGYKYPKLSELCAYFEISDVEIAKKVEEMFGEKTSFHDARFDTVAVYLCLNESLINHGDYFGIGEYL